MSKLVQPDISLRAARANLHQRVRLAGIRRFVTRAQRALPRDGTVERNAERQFIARLAWRVRALGKQYPSPTPRIGSSSSPASGLLDRPPPATIHVSSQRHPYHDGLSSQVAQQPRCSAESLRSSDSVCFGAPDRVADRHVFATRETAASHPARARACEGARPGTFSPILRAVVRVAADRASGPHRLSCIC
jgi:hypothetical protein